MGPKPLKVEELFNAMWVKLLHEEQVLVRDTAHQVNLECARNRALEKLVESQSEPQKMV